MISICTRVWCVYFNPYKKCMAKECPYKNKEAER